MNDLELNRILKAAKVPEKPGEFWAHFPRRVTSRLPWKTTAMRKPANWFPRLALGLGTMAACVIVGFAIVRWPGHSQTDSFTLLQNDKILREILTMFPNRVRAIEQDEHGLRLVLSDHPDVPASPPLWIKICDGKQCRVVVTFSGQEFSIAKETVEVLADAQGQVMLVGDRLFWSSAEPDRAARHLRIQARPLAYAL